MNPPGWITLTGHRVLHLRADAIDYISLFPEGYDMAEFACLVKIHGIDIERPVEETADQVLKLIDEALSR